MSDSPILSPPPPCSLHVSWAASSSIQYLPVVLRFTTLGEAADRTKGQTGMVLNLHLDFLDHLHTQNLR